LSFEESSKTYRRYYANCGRFFAIDKKVVYIYGMKKSIFVVFMLFLGLNVKAQKRDSLIINDTINPGKKFPFIDDSSLYPDKQGIYRECKPMPSFPRGQEALRKFLAKNAKWPDKSGMIDVQGKVLVTFVVEKTGELTHLKITKSLNPIFDKEVLHVIKLSPKWIPGKVNGKKVRCWYTVPFNFSLNN